ncbi:hypothetical protein M569_12676 [Genlisea aurea]|uniref:Uncharacterized protein n=1 Tax=Genlisea aurea TaxID=192259 RepID=S8DH17_9LAMI|nr:hypothetical protein M569_12676 [Genlisea aurea]
MDLRRDRGCFLETPTAADGGNVTENRLLPRLPHYYASRTRPAQPRYPQPHRFPPRPPYLPRSYLEIIYFRLFAVKVRSMKFFLMFDDIRGVPILHEEVLIS